MWTSIPDRLAAIRHHHRLHLLGEHPVRFVEKEHLLFFTRALPFHANGLRFIGFDVEGRELTARTYYSVGGGFVVSEELASDGTAQKRVAPGHDDPAAALPHRRRVAGAMPRHTVCPSRR